MENDDYRTVRVYTKKYTSKDKDGNAIEKESKQKQVSLKKKTLLKIMILFVFFQVKNMKNWLAISFLRIN